MTILVGAVSQEPGFVGWVAATAVVILLVSSFLLLVVAGGAEGFPIQSAEDELVSAAVVPAAAVDMPARQAVPTDISKAAQDYAAFMAPALQPVVEAVIQRAQLRIGERVLDAGTGTGVGAAAAFSPSRSVVGVDTAEDLLAIARRSVFGVHFVEADLAALPFPPGWFHVVISVHALYLADDPVAVLAEWRRVTIGGGRLSLSMPGPRAVTAISNYQRVYRRHGFTRPVEVPTARKMTTWARSAGWQQVEIVADPTTVIRLAGPDAFGRWIRTPRRSYAAGVLESEHSEVLERDLLAATPTRPGGRLEIPFGSLYLTARNSKSDAAPRARRQRVG